MKLNLKNLLYLAFIIVFVLFAAPSYLATEADEKLDTPPTSHYKRRRPKPLELPDRSLIGFSKNQPPLLAESLTGGLIGTIYIDGAVAQSLNCKHSFSRVYDHEKKHKPKTSCRFTGEHTDKFIEPSIWLAINEHNLEMAKKWFIKNREKIDSLIDQYDSSGETALHFAIFKNSETIVQLLLDNGADPRLKNHSGDNALHLAVRNENLNIIENILPHYHIKEMINAKNNLGETPLDLVQQKPKPNSKNLKIIANHLMRCGGLASAPIPSLEPIAIHVYTPIPQKL